MNIGENIRKIREVKGLGVNEVSRLSGVNASYISAIEKDVKSNPSNEILYKLADTLEVDIADFYKDSINDVDLYKNNTKHIDIYNKDNFRELISRDNTPRDDIERFVLFYIIAENEDLYNKVDDIYDFEERGITPYKALEGKGGYDFCGSSRSLISIAYNLYNGYPADILGTLYNLDEINYKIALNAINVRFGKRVLEV